MTVSGYFLFIIDINYFKKRYISYKKVFNYLVFEVSTCTLSSYQNEFFYDIYFQISVNLLLTHQLCLTKQQQQQNKRLYCLNNKLNSLS